MNWKILLPSGERFVNFPELFSGVQWHCAAASKITGAMAMVMVVALEARTIIEIGIANGFSTQCLARALTVVADADGLLVSCDHVEMSIALSENMCHGLPIKHKTIMADSADIHWADFLEGRLCDVAFVDGDHEYEPAKRDLMNCATVMSERGIMVAHDYAPGQPGVIQAVDEMEAEGWHKWTFPELYGLGDYGWAILHR